MHEKRPLIITVIGAISIFGAFLTIASLFPKFLEQFEIYSTVLHVFSATIMRVLISIIQLIAAYGYLRLKNWGYWLMIIIIVFYLVLYIIFSQQRELHFVYLKFITTAIELVFIVRTKKYFVNKNL